MKNKNILLFSVTMLILLLGISIVSTSKGIMTGKEAKKENLGGEVLAYIW